jgi:hypothetical protein
MANVLLEDVDELAAAAAFPRSKFEGSLRKVDD